MLRNVNVEVLWNNSDGASFKTVGNTSFSALQKVILNPKTLERKSILT